MTKSFQEELKGYKISRFVLLIGVLSFLGWAFESVVVFYLCGRFYDCGFMSLPFCPIYGFSLFIAYMVIGTPDYGGIFLQRVKRKKWRYLLYFAVAFLIPSVMEFFVGWFFDGAFGLRLWSYVDTPLNIKGYVSLPVSLAWSALLFLFMKTSFLPIKNLVGKISLPIAQRLAYLLILVSMADFTLGIARLIF